MMNVGFCMLMVVAVLPFTNGYIPRFLKGRPRGGFLGSPGGRLTSPHTVAKEKWFVQPLNHFDQSDTRTWKQKYFVNEFFYKAGGPLFVQVGGEGKASPIWMTNGAWVNYAKTYNAYCVMVEHRYYGDSHPTPDLSTANLHYLSSEQALEDLAKIVSYFNDTLDGPKVIVFGGSYSGALSAWFRMKYPHLAHGAVASSAPVLAKVNFKEYLEVVDASLKTYDGEGQCNSNINFATALLTHLVKTPAGRNMVKKIFNLCTDIDSSSSKDVGNFFSTIANNILGVVQYNRDNRAFEGAKDAGITIDSICTMMTNSSTGSQLERYANINAMMLKIHGEKCTEFNYNAMIKDMQMVNWSSSAAEGGRQWVYQTCTEFAYFQSSDGGGQPFGNFFPVKFSIDQCTDIYGQEFTESIINAGVKDTNIHYGAKGLKVTRVLFPNGSIDPWHALSILKDLNPEARAIYIKGTAHCANMYPPSPNDLPALKQAREEIEKTIGQWLAEE